MNIEVHECGYSKDTDSFVLVFVRTMVDARKKERPHRGSSRLAPGEHGS
jgi:hypothetical protein